MDISARATAEDPRRLETVIGVKDFASLFNASSWKREFLSAFLEALEKKLGTEILLKVPRSLREVHPSILRNLRTIEKMRALKLLENVGFMESLPDEPPLLRAYVRGTGRGSGAHFFDAERALWSALGECTERSLWFESAEWYKGKVKTSTYKKLSGEKLNPRTLAGFSAEQKERDSMLHADENTTLGWIKTKNWISGKNTWVPAQLLSAEYCRTRQRSPLRPNNPEPLLRSAVTTGLATSSESLEEAVLYGTLEVIERDAFMISYLNKLSPPRLNLESLSAQDEDIKNTLASLARYHLRAELLLLPTDFPFFVVAGVLLEETGQAAQTLSEQPFDPELMAEGSGSKCKGPAFAIGAKAHWSLKQAVLGALSEAVSVRYSLKDSLETPVDMDKIGRKERLIYWAKPENLSKIDFFTAGEMIEKNLAEKESPVSAELGRLLKFMREKNYPLFAAEVSSRASLKCGFRSAFVCAPDLQPMHLDERVPALGGYRLQEVPITLGYKQTEALNRDPHPFP